MPIKRLLATLGAATALVVTASACTPEQARILATQQSGGAVSAFDSTPPTPAAVPGTWRLTFADEFNGSALDTSRWEPSWFGGASATKPINTAEVSCYDPRQVGVGGGWLQLSAVARPCTANNGRTYSYASGIVTTRRSFTFTYGYFEARVWVEGSLAKATNWPAFWADGTGQWPTTGEIDVFEALSGRLCWHFHYTGGGPGACPATASMSGWHTFGADWEPGVITFYYDGRAVGQQTQGVTSSPMFLIANLGLSPTIAPPVAAPSTMLVDYVRVWQH